MFCNKCGKELSEDSRFCSGCGNQIGTSVSSSSTSQATYTAQSSDSSFSVNSFLQNKSTHYFVSFALSVVTIILSLGSWVRGFDFGFLGGRNDYVGLYQAIKSLINIRESVGDYVDGATSGVFVFMMLVFALMYVIPIINGYYVYKLVVCNSLVDTKQTGARAAFWSIALCIGFVVTVFVVNTMLSGQSDGFANSFSNGIFQYKETVYIVIALGFFNHFSIPYVKFRDKFSVNPAFDGWSYKKCNTQNLSSHIRCKSCGEYK